MKLQKTLLTFFSISILANGFAQTTGISINTQFSNYNPSNFDNFASLIVYFTGDRSKTATISSSGQFTFESVIPNTYIILICNNEGRCFASDTIQVDSNSLSNRNLSIDFKNLKEIPVNSAAILKSKPIIEQRADRVIVNTEQFIGGAAQSAWDLLSRCPGVIVQENGKIILKGKNNVNILIDGKPASIVGPDLENYLRSIPAAAVKQIELIPNPPANFDAAGTGGIIQFKLNRSKQKGLTGSVSVSYGQGIFNRSNNIASMQYNTKKFQVYGAAAYSLQKVYQNLFIDRNYGIGQNTNYTYFEQNSIIKNFRNNYSARLGVEYYPKPNQIIGITVRGLHSPIQDDVANTSNILLSNREKLNTVTANNLGDWTMKNFQSSAIYKYIIDNFGSQFEINYDRINYSFDINQTFNNRFYNSKDSLFLNQDILGKSPSNIIINAAKADYSKHFGNNSKFETGIKMSVTQTDNEAFYQEKQFNYLKPLYSLSNHFLYNERIAAAYINWSRSFQKLELQLGLRVENTNSKGNQLGNPLVPKSRFNRNYTNLFPTVFVTKVLDSVGKHVLNFNAGKRIDRPNFQDLNPFFRPLDNFTFYGGNPLLRPTLAYNCALSYTLNNKHTFAFNFGFSDEGIFETLEIVNGIYYSRPGNIGKAIVYNISNSHQFQFQKGIVLVLSGETGYLLFNSKLYNTTLKDQSFYSVVNGSISKQFKKDWAAEITGNVQSNFQQAQVTTKWYGTVNLAASKKILQKRMNIKLSITDVLYSMKIKGEINNLTDAKATYSSRLDSRVVWLNISYNFGQNPYKRGINKSKGSEEEQQRIKNA